MKDSLVTSSSRAQTGTTCKIVSARISSRFEKKCNNQMNNDIIIIAVIYKVRKTEKVRKKLKKTHTGTPLDTSKITEIQRCSRLVKETRAKRAI